MMALPEKAMEPNRASRKPDHAPRRAAGAAARAGLPLWWKNAFGGILGIASRIRSRMAVASDPAARGAPPPHRVHAFARRLQVALDAVTTAGAWLVLPLVALLCAQWPLRDVVA